MATPENQNETDIQGPKFSIIVPIYNAEKYLHQCIDSVLNQSFKDYELWLIDDGSKDSSIEIIKEYALRDSRIHTAFIKGDGPSVPRNYGLNRATGEYVLFLDSDDYLTENSLLTFALKTEQFPDADYIRGNQLILIDNKREAKSVFASSRSKFADRMMNGEDFMVDVLQCDYAPIDALFKLSFLNENHIRFHEELIILEDGPFIAEICASGAKCVYITEETYVYRLFNPDSVTNSPKTYRKSLSLVEGAQYYLKLLDKFGEKGQEIMKARSSDHLMSGLYQACAFLKKEEGQKIYNFVKSHNRKIAVRSTYGRHHLLTMRAWNLSPRLTFAILNLIKRLRH